MGVQINGSTGNVIATRGTFSGNVGIAGTLTYEDVTDIDAVGLITARSGIEVGASPGVGASISRQGNAIFSGITTIGSKEVGAGITLSPDGHVSVSGVTTSSTIHIGVDTGVYGEDLVVTGNSRVTGIASFGTSDNPAMHVNIGMSTLSAAPVLTVPDMIKHSGDPETRVRFDTGAVTVETTKIERLRINSSGQVTKPNQFHIVVSRSGNQSSYNPSQGFGTGVVYNNVVTTQGAADSALDTSNGRVTVPLDGIYFLEGSAYSDSAVFTQGWFTKNGSRLSYSDFMNNSGNSQNVNSVGFHKLAADDTIGFKAYGSSSTSTTIVASSNHTWMRITLVG